MERQSTQEHQLTTSLRAVLARSISRNSVAAIAAEHLGFDDETIENIRYETRDDCEAFNRKIFEKWANQNPGDNQKQVRFDGLY